MDASTYRVLVIGGEAAAPLLAAGGSEGGDKAEFDLSRASTIAEARRRLETASYDTILMNLASSQVAAAFPEELYALASASPVVLFNQSADGHDGAGQARLRLPLGAPATRALSAESHRHFGQLLEAVPDALIVTNQDNEVAFVNRAAHELFGKARDDFIGERVSFAVSEGAVSEIEVYRGKDVRRCELRVSRCEWEGAPAQLLLIQDVTEQKRLNEELRQSQKMEAVGVLAGGIAHDFNNLLVVMMIYAEMLREECLGDDPRLPDVMELIKAIERGRDLTRQLLAFSRKQPATPTLLDLGATLADLQKMFRRLLPSNIEISIDVEEQSWPVIADRVQVEQLIMNLALNARDAMPSGGQLTIRLANRTIQCGDEGMEPGDYVMMTVSDTGTGIPPDDLDRIFDPFFTTKVRGGGTGLGLATCYGIVKQAGGSIAVRSAIGEGTSFIVLLPRANETIQTEAAPAPPVQQARGGERILLVEDNSLAQRATAAMLTRAGYSVQSTSNGEEALRFLREHADAVDLVLSDVVMPRLSGPELARQLAVSHPDLPVLFMTGYSNDPIIADAGEHRIGGRRTIMKPFKREDLLAFISDAIERKRCAEAS